jgi:hypothetical protein
MTSGTAIRIFLGTAAALVLAGCGGAARGPQLNTQFAQVSANEAFATLPPGGPPTVTVIQKNYINARSQDIVLTTMASSPGENRLSVSMFGRMPENTGAENRLPNMPDSQSELGVELQKEFPQTAMKIAPYYVQNKYGPFGYAMGRPAPGELCMYAWQRITQSTGPNVNIMFTPRGAIVVRLRVCEAGATESSLVALMYGYVINATFNESNWNPYGSPVEVPATIGVAGADPVVPMSVTGPATVIEGAQGPDPEAVTERRLRNSARPRRRVVREAVPVDFAPPAPVRDYSMFPEVPVPPPGVN